MLPYLLRRLATAIPTLLLVAAAVFFLLRLVPGDPALRGRSRDLRKPEAQAAARLSPGSAAQ